MAKTTSLGLNADGDLDFRGGQLRKVEGAAYLQQKVRCVMSFFRGEWYLDLEGVGVPYFELVFDVKDPHIPTVRAELQRHLAAIKGITSVAAVDAVVDGVTRRFGISYNLVGDLGQLLTDTVEVIPP